MHLKVFFTKHRNNDDITIKRQSSLTIKLGVWGLRKGLTPCHSV